MRRIVTSIVLLLLVPPASQAEDRREDKTRLKVMSFNAEFLWDGVAPEEGASSVTFPWKGDQAKAEAHMAEVASVIKKHRPDLVCLVEVENLDALQALNQKFLADQGYVAYLEEGVDTTTGQDVGLLARVDPLTFRYDNTEGTSESVEKRQSKGFVAEFQINDTRIAMIGVHFLAQPDNHGRKLLREAQADAVRRIATQKKDEGFAVIVAGDFNDYDFHVRDHLDSVPIAKTLFIAKMMEFGEFEDDLKTVALKIPKENRYTAHWDKNDNETVDEGELTSIDHILLSPSLFELVSEAQIDQTHNPVEVSDHFPLVTTLQFVDGTPEPEILPSAARRVAAAPAEADAVPAASRRDILSRIEAIERQLEELKRLLNAM